MRGCKLAWSLLAIGPMVQGAQPALRTFEPGIFRIIGRSIGINIFSQRYAPGAGPHGIKAATRAQIQHREVEAEQLAFEAKFRADPRPVVVDSCCRSQRHVARSAGEFRRRDRSSDYIGLAYPSFGLEHTHPQKLRHPGL